MRIIPILSALLRMHGAIFGQTAGGGSGTRLTLEEAQSLAAMRAYNVRYASIDAKEAASNTRELIASGFPQVSGSVEYNRYIDIPTQVSSGDAFGFPDYLTAFLGGVAQATGVPLDAPPVDPNALQAFQFGQGEAVALRTALVFRPRACPPARAARSEQSIGLTRRVHYSSSSPSSPPCSRQPRKMLKNSWAVPP